MNKKRKLLVVDDDPISLSIIIKGLKSNDYKVTGCKSGEEAILAWEYHDDFDLMLIDYDMYPMTGTQAVKEIKKKFDIPFVLVTSHVKYEIITETIKLNPLNYIVKPVNIEGILPQVEIAILLWRHFQSLSNDFTANRSINYSIGIISERFKLSIDDAKKLVLKHVRGNNYKVKDFTRDIINEHEKNIENQNLIWNIHEQNIIKIK